MRTIRVKSSLISPGLARTSLGHDQHSTGGRVHVPESSRTRIVCRQAMRYFRVTSRLRNVPNNGSRNFIQLHEIAEPLDVFNSSRRPTRGVASRVRFSAKPISNRLGVYQSEIAIKAGVSRATVARIRAINSPIRIARGNQLQSNN